jgi:uncharacterized protein YlbG (UPF0298 family)
MKTHQKIPYGISDFASLIKEQYCFIDNTRYIEMLENMGGSYLFFFRPRRFGKSLFLSMLSYYYGIQHKDKFESLFSEQYIGKHPTPMVNQYAVLFFDFQDIDTTNEESILLSFVRQIRLGLSQFMEEYDGFDAKKKEEILSQDTPSSLVLYFFGAYKIKHENKIYLLIDNYESFVHTLLASGRIAEIDMAIDMIRTFYAVIKSATGEGIVNRIFITGIIPISLNGLTAGFNIGWNISDAFVFHQLTGFQPEQVEELIDNCFDLNPESKQLLINELNNRFLGYKFCEKAEKIFSPDMVLHFLSAYQKDSSIPQKMLSEEYAKDLNALSPQLNSKNISPNIKEGKEINMWIIQQFSFARHFGDSDFINLLYYMGYLTLGKKTSIGTTPLVIPNEAIQKLLIDL